MSTLLLTRTDVQHAMDALTLLEEMRAAFRADSTRPGDEPPPASVATGLAGGLQVSLPGALPGIPACSVKVEHGDGRGVVHLYARDTGALLAVMEAGHLAALAQGVVGALAADVLARPDASRVALIGAGPSASMQLKSLRLVRGLQHVRVYDAQPVRGVDFAARMYKALNLPVRPAMSVEEAVEDADVVITATGSAEPLLFPGMVRAGTHISALGAQGPGRAEVAPGLLRQSSFFCDAPARAAVLGEAPVPTALGAVLAGAAPGRRDVAEVTIFGGMRPAWQDLVAAWHVYQGVRGDDAARRLDLEA
ncbi:ornithine cyclodeaminase family protein [Archangium primigenium]|uniref:ornithine cyclodeaminase family protein n=1 Tax=[Archangium] primigenium TaxID=2792470 RepID=UPI00195A568E|nr:ornithine cyclodeaminase family protein [Archangium primigenium]MBM7112939.1 ornithine cyclodeaminase family protein [Archangium primigenium]